MAFGASVWHAKGLRHRRSNEDRQDVVKRHARHAVVAIVAYTMSGPKGSFSFDLTVNIPEVLMVRASLFLAWFAIGLVLSAFVVLETASAVPTSGER